MANGGLRPINRTVQLHPATATTERTLKEFAGAERIYWVQCPRCRQQFWYALRYDTGATEIQFFGRQFRERFQAEACPNHSLESLILPDTATPGG